MKRVLTTLALGALFGIPWSCVDTSPIDYHEPKTDAGLMDAPSISADAARVLECKQCVTKDSCNADYGKCAAQGGCGALMDCLLDSFCVNIPSDLSQLPPCLTACGLKAGIKSADDPAVVLFRTLLFCTQDNCRAPCGIMAM